MKKLVLGLLAAPALLALTACTDSAIEKTATDHVRQVMSGNQDAVCGQYSDDSFEEAAAKIACVGMVKLQYLNAENRGGVESIKVKKLVKSDDGKRAKVRVLVKYLDETTDIVTVDLIKQDKNWLVQ